MNSAVSRFEGPLFIVGMPRSGTKLLRDLLNRHAQINIPEVESHFLPKWHQAAQVETDFYTSISAEFQKTAYAISLNKRGIAVDLNQLGHIANQNSIAEVFQFLAKSGTEEPFQKGQIWGDKTPGYLLHIDTIRSIFPGARFIHIIRDPRDYVLSVENAWNKSKIRAAFRWNRSVQKGIMSGKSLGSDYHELSYESLLNSPEKELKKLCSFLSIDFDSAMLSLGKASENLGEAKGSLTIKTNNSAKWKSRLSNSELRQIESLCFDTMKNCGYSIEEANKQLNLSSLELKWLKLKDGLNILRFQIAQRGLFSGVRYTLAHYKRSSWQ